MLAQPEPIEDRFTIEEYYSIDEEPPYSEFDKGEIIPMVPPHFRHQEVLSEITSAVRTFVKSRRLGKVWQDAGIQLPGPRVYIPDLLFLGNEKLVLCDEEKGIIMGAPDLVVEIVSRSDPGRDRVKKFNVYFETGVKWYWIVDPFTLVIEEYKAETGGYVRKAAAVKGETFKPEAFPGLEIDLSALVG